MEKKLKRELAKSKGICIWCFKNKSPIRVVCDKCQPPRNKRVSNFCVLCEEFTGLRRKLYCSNCARKRQNASALLYQKRVYYQEREKATTLISSSEEMEKVRKRLMKE